MLVLLHCALATARAAPPAAVLLAPTIADLDGAQTRLTQLLEAAHAQQEAVSALHTAWTQSAPAHEEPCSDPATLELGWRAERFGSAWRDAAQSARVEAARVRGVVHAPTVAPLVDTERGARVSTLLAEVDTASRAMLEAGAWSTTYVRPFLAACPRPPHLPAGVDRRDGPAPRTPVPRREASPPRAVLALGDGWLCTAEGATRADDAVVLVQGEHACWSAEERCACTQLPVAPGAVFGPYTDPATSAATMEEEGRRDP